MSATLLLARAAVVLLATGSVLLTGAVVLLTAAAIVPLAAPLVLLTAPLVPLAASIVVLSAPLVPLAPAVVLLAALEPGVGRRPPSSARLRLPARVAALPPSAGLALRTVGLVVALPALLAAAFAAVAVPFVGSLLTAWRASSSRPLPAGRTGTALAAPIESLLGVRPALAALRVSLAPRLVASSFLAAPPAAGAPLAGTVELVTTGLAEVPGRL